MRLILAATPPNDPQRERSLKPPAERLVLGLIGALWAQFTAKTRPNFPPDVGRRLCLASSCLPEPVSEPPEGKIPAGPAHTMERVCDRSDVGCPNQRDDGLALDEEIVQPDKLHCACCRIKFALRRPEERVVFLAPPARDVVALPLVVLLRDVPGGEKAEEPLGVGASRPRVGDQLQVGVEMRVGVGVCRVRAEERRGRDGLKLDLDPCFRGRLLEDLLNLLRPSVDGRLKEELELLAVLRPDAIRAALPAGRVEDLVSLVDAELVIESDQVLAKDNTACGAG